MTREDYEKLSTDDQISYWKGQMLFGIGKGDLNTEIFRMMDFLHRLGYERGNKSTTEKEKTMKVVVWKSYGDIKVYAADTAEQLEGIIDTMVTCVDDWGMENVIERINAHVEKHKGNRPEIVRAFNTLTAAVGVGSHETFEDVFLTTVEEKCE